MLHKACPERWKCSQQDKHVSFACCKDIQSPWAAEEAGMGSGHISQPLLCQASSDLLKGSSAHGSAISGTTGAVTAGKGSVSVPLCLQLPSVIVPQCNLKSLCSWGLVTWDTSPAGSEFWLRLNLSLDSDVNCSSLVMGKLQKGKEGMQQVFRSILPSGMGIPGSVFKRMKRNKQKSAPICTLICRNKINCSYHLIYWLDATRWWTAS